MNKEIKLKNYIWVSLATAITATVGMLIILGIPFLGYFLSSGKFDITAKIILIVLGGIIAFTWSMFFLSLFFSKKIVVSDEGIKAERFGKTVWSFKKEDIWECYYSKLTWKYLLIMMPIEAFASPFSTPTNGVLFIRLHNGKISRRYCVLTKRQVNKIKQNFDYTFKDEQSLYE